MPEYLIILITILVSFGIVGILFGLYIFHRMHYLIRKTEFLIEDISFKINSLSPLIDTFLKLNTYINVIDKIIQSDDAWLKKVIDSNKPEIRKFKAEIKKHLKNTK